MIREKSNILLSRIRDKYFSTPTNEELLGDSNFLLASARYILIVSIICVFIIPFFMKSVASYDFFVFGNTPSEIGGAIGGMTAPIIGLLNAVLLYQVFQFQTKTNIDSEKNRRSEKAYQFEYELVKNVIGEVNNYKIDMSKVEFNSFGDNYFEFVSFAMKNYDVNPDYFKCFEKDINNFRDLVSLSKSLISGIEQNKDLDIFQKNHLYNLFGITFNKRIYTCFLEHSQNEAYNQLRFIVIEIRKKLPSNFSRVSSGE